MTQAAISSRIAALETQFGVRLFERDERGVILTNSGTDLVKYAEQLLHTNARMMEAIADRATHKGRVTIGVVEVVVHTWLPALLTRFREAYPNASVEIHSDNTPKVQQELLDGQIDLAFTMGAMTDPGVENRIIFDYSVQWVASPSLGLSKKPDSAKIFSRVPVLTFLRDSIVCIDVTAKLSKYEDVLINPCSSIAAIVSLLKSGFGIASLPVATIQEDLANGTLVIVDVEPRLAPLSLHANLRSAGDSPLVEPLVLFAKEAAKVFAQRFPSSGVHPGA
jgi:DNA-binding transcriptional LysR family regulator